MTVVGPLFMIAVVAIMIYTFHTSLARGKTARRVQTGPLARLVETETLPINCAGAIDDPGQTPSQALLQALCIHPHTDADYDADDEGVGRGLGLTYHRHRHLAGGWDPAVYDGVRNGRQVWMRLGRSYETMRGPGFGMRRMRCLAVLRIGAPAFELTATAGRLTGTDVPAPVAAVLARMTPAPDVWHDLRLVAGPEGVVISRGSANDFAGGWPYDLWLLERIAFELDAPSLAPVDHGREWEPPYDLNTWAPPLRDMLV
jgi:hypothetical protein